jgi:hypothetical protein
MKQKDLFFLLILALIATAIAVPVPEENHETSLGQHLGTAALWIVGGLASVAMAIGGITYGVNWLNRFQKVQSEYKADTADWNAAQTRKDKEHEKKMAAEDLIIGVTRNYTDNVGKEIEGFNPFEIPEALEDELEQSRLQEPEIPPITPEADPHKGNSGN